MRLCRYQSEDAVRVAFYEHDGVVDLADAWRCFSTEPMPDAAAYATDNLLNFLPPNGVARRQVRKVYDALRGASPTEQRGLLRSLDDAHLLVPVPQPSKLLLLAGNYGKHIEEGGRATAPERPETFPYVFMKPPATTLTHPGAAVRLPAVSPEHIDWELELAVVMGRRCSRVKEAEALQYVAGYTIVNDISDRKFRPNPQRRKRDKDEFFDWLHGKWHDTFCPMGPCLLSADDLPDPQTLGMKLAVNGEVKQDASTAEMIFPVAAIIEFISSFVTLEPGDVISTGTPHGVGFAKGTYLRRGDVIVAEIEKIGVLRNPVE